MSTPLLAACVVVTEDVTDLHAVLASLQHLRPLVGEICVYGAGASDRVLEYARSAGARVGVGASSADLSAARNQAALMTELPWVLLLEPDERIVADPTRLERLLDVAPGMMAQPDVLSLQLRRVDDDEDVAVARQERIYRPSVARFEGAFDPRMVPVSAGRRLTVLTPGRDVACITRSAEPEDAALARGRLERRIARADAVVAKLENEGVAGNDLVTALVERARLLREIDEDNAALADLTRARKVRAGKEYRWRARQELTTLLVKHGHFAGAERLIGELERDGADPGYTAWLRAQVSAAQGRAADALEILRGLDQVVAADGRVVASPEILNERMVMAARVGDFEEALQCCVDLVSRHGQSRRFGRMLLKLWGGRRPEGLADRLVASGGLHQEGVAASLRQLGPTGEAVAASLLDEAREPRPEAVRVM